MELNNLEFKLGGWLWRENSQNLWNLDGSLSVWIDSIASHTCGFGDILHYNKTLATFWGDYSGPYVFQVHSNTDIFIIEFDTILILIWISLGTVIINVAY